MESNSDLPVRKAAGKYAAITERTNSQGELWFDVVKYGDRQSVLTTVRSEAGARNWCDEHGYEIVGKQPELFTKYVPSVGVVPTDPDDGLTPMQRKVLNKFATSATLRKEGKI